MKLFLLALLVLCSLQKYIIEEYHHDTCESPIAVGVFIQPNKCYLNSNRMKYEPLSEGFYQIGDGCNKECTDCREWKTYDYGCRNSRGFVTTRFGEIRGVKPKGFLMQEFLESPTCEDSKEMFGFIYYDAHCEPVPDKVNKTLEKSGKMEWDDRRNGVLYTEYNGSGCRGNVIFNEFLPANRCVLPSRYAGHKRYKFRKN